MPNPATTNPGPDSNTRRAVTALVRAFLHDDPADAPVPADVSPQDLATGSTSMGVGYPAYKAACSLSEGSDYYADVRSAMKPQRLRQLAMSVKLFEDAKVVVRALQDAGVDHIPFKGPFLSLDLFGNPDARSSCDIDIILPGGRADIDRAVDALGTIGYQRPRASTTRFKPGPSRLPMVSSARQL